MKPFMTINQAAEASGLSVFYIRRGVKNGFVPCVKCGKKYLINYQMFIEKLNTVSNNSTFDFEKAIGENNNG